MPKAEAGSTKYIANKMKSKGLQRLRWYCQVCEKQCRDENGFKQHTMSEGHVRAMLHVSENSDKFVREYSNQFKRDFLLLLKTAHGEKKVHMNNFYQEYIRDKEHIHMNSTKWPSLTEFAKFLGREGLCRVEEGDKGLEISFIDDSPEAVRRREDLKKKEAQKQGDEDTEARLLEEQMQRARAALQAKKQREEAEAIISEPIENEKDGEPVKVAFKLGTKKAATSQPAKEENTTLIEGFSQKDTNKPNADGDTSTAPVTDEAPAKVSLSLAMKKKPVSAFSSKKSAFSTKKDTAIVQPEKPMSNQERIMKEEIARKRAYESRGHQNEKRTRLM